MKKTVCLIFAVLICISAVSCSKDGNTVMKIGKSEIDVGMYTYLTATYKASFLATYNNGFDTEEFWKTEVETESGTVTYRSYIEDYIYDNVSRMLVSAYKFDEAGLELSDEGIEKIDGEINDLLKEESESELNESLSAYGIDREGLRKVKLMQTKSEAYFSYMYENKGEKAPSTAELDEYIKTNYRAVGFVTIYTKKAPILKDNGEYTYDDNGDIVMYTLSDTEKEQKNAIVENVMSALENGAGYDEVKEFSDEDYSDFEKGLLICNSDVNNYGRNIVQKALAMDIGDYAKAEKDGTVYIMVCLESPEYSALSSNYSLSDIYSNCTTDKYFADMDSAVSSDVTVYDDALKKIDITTVKQNKIY